MTKEPFPCSSQLRFKKYRLKKVKREEMCFGKLLNISFVFWMDENCIVAIFVIVYNEGTIDANFCLYKL